MKKKENNFLFGKLDKFQKEFSYKIALPSKTAQRIKRLPTREEKSGKKLYYGS